jgi:hypothetical protein
MYSKTLGNFAEWTRRTGDDPVKVIAAFVATFAVSPTQCLT